MDPWYFLDLETNVRDGDETLELMDISSVYPNGSWDLNTEGYEGQSYIMVKNIDQLNLIMIIKN